MEIENMEIKIRSSRKLKVISCKSHSEKQLISMGNRFLKGCWLLAAGRW
jgi:hypothetical protein